MVVIQLFEVFLLLIVLSIGAVIATILYSIILAWEFGVRLTNRIKKRIAFTISKL